MAEDSGENIGDNTENARENGNSSLTKEELYEQKQTELGEFTPVGPRKAETEVKVQPQADAQRPFTVQAWLSAVGWKANPFVFNIDPSLLVGYRQQSDRVMMALEEKHKFLLVLGPTGSGKTTFLKWLESRMKNSDVIYVGKPPLRAEEFVSIFNEKYKRRWYAFWENKLASIYQIPEFLNTKLAKKHLVLLVDEAHEANTEILEWLRVLNDQVGPMSIVLSGLPNFEDQLRSDLETFSKRITAKIALLSLTKEETRELIVKRIKSVGGNGSEFSHVFDPIYEYTGGFPREVIRVCDELVNDAILAGRTQIEFNADEHREEKFVQTVATPIEKMTPMQKEILDLLSRKPLTPGQIANTLDLAKYKSRQHAVRSINNIMKALYENGYLDRKREDKAYVYSLSQKISTLFVKS